MDGRIQAAALQYLQQDSILHMDMIELIRRANAQIIAASEEGVLLLATAGDIYMLAASHLGAACTLLDYADHPPMLVVHQEFCCAEVQRRFGYTTRQKCIQAVYCSKNQLYGTNEIEVRRLDHTHTPVLCQYYHAMDNVAYMEARVAAGEMYGAFYEGELAGFIGTHQEGSIGLLEVLPAFRHRGVAQALERDAINRALQRGQTPFCQVIHNNYASLCLQKKLGMTLSAQPLYWMF